jgi:serine/threonine protein kinase
MDNENALQGLGYPLNPVRNFFKYALMTDKNTAKKLEKGVVEGFETILRAMITVPFDKTPFLNLWGRHLRFMWSINAPFGEPIQSFFNMFSLLVDSQPFMLYFIIYFSQGGFLHRFKLYSPFCNYLLSQKCNPNLPQQFPNPLVEKVFAHNGDPAQQSDEPLFTAFAADHKHPSILPVYHVYSSPTESSIFSPQAHGTLSELDKLKLSVGHHFSDDVDVDWFSQLNPHNPHPPDFTNRLDAISLANNATFSRLWEVIGGLLHGLDYLHNTLGIAHLDIKPDNIYWTKTDDDQIIIQYADFGHSSMAAFPPNIPPEPIQLTLTDYFHWARAQHAHTGQIDGFYSPSDIARAITGQAINLPQRPHQRPPFMACYSVVNGIINAPQQPDMVLPYFIKGVWYIDANGNRNTIDFPANHHINQKREWFNLTCQNLHANLGIPPENIFISFNPFVDDCQFTKTHHYYAKLTRSISERRFYGRRDYPGTANYISMERINAQILNIPFDQYKSDQFSLGVTLFELIFGFHPYRFDGLPGEHIVVCDWFTNAELGELEWFDLLLNTLQRTRNLDPRTWTRMHLLVRLYPEITTLLIRTLHPNPAFRWDIKALCLWYQQLQQR